MNLVIEIDSDDNNGPSSARHTATATSSELMDILRGLQASVDRITSQQLTASLPAPTTPYILLPYPPQPLYQNFIPYVAPPREHPSTSPAVHPSVYSSAYLGAPSLASAIAYPPIPTPQQTPPQNETATQPYQPPPHNVSRSICPICKDEENFTNVVFIECGHMFCEDCVASMEAHEIAWKCGFCNTVGDYVIGFILN